jgi:hypothetical protein
MTLDTPTTVVEQPTRYIDRLIASYVAEEEAAPTAEAAELSRTGPQLEQMDTSSRQAMSLRMSRFIDAMRQAEREQSGAFYETRRPH